MLPDPVEALTRAFLEADGYDPDEEVNVDTGLVRMYRKQAEIAVETLKGIGWGEVEPYREAQREVLRRLEEAFSRPGWPHEYDKDLHKSACRGCLELAVIRKMISRSEVDA